MDIKMVGIDHNKAKIEDRERFAFTQSSAVAAMEYLQGRYDFDGCLLLSTCNRTELWLAGCGQASPSLLLCQSKKLDPALVGDIFVERQGQAALEHLLELACGLKSKVFGEDQIITQLKEALDLARDCHAAGPVLETCFRIAISGAKKVKTYVRLTPYDSSVATSMVSRLAKMFNSLAGVQVLVVGNGEIGRLAAKTLVAAGCQVTMTLRQYKRGSIVVPEGCNVVQYDERLAQINDYQVIVSATTSPHYTFHAPEVLSQLDEKNRVWVDLAVPRDIDPQIGDHPKNTLFDIDNLGGIALDPANNPNVAQAKEILAEYKKEFENWYYFREYIPMVEAISQRVGAEAAKKSKPAANQLDLSPEAQQNLQAEVAKATAKSLANLLYGVKDELNREDWQACFAALERSANR